MIVLVSSGAAQCLTYDVTEQLCHHAMMFWHENAKDVLTDMHSNLIYAKNTNP
jgi:hypothetical protein